MKNTKYNTNCECKESFCHHVLEASYNAKREYYAELSEEIADEIGDESYEFDNESNRI